MRKVDLVKELSKRTGETNIHANFLVDEVFSIIEEALLNDEKVYVPKLGTLSTKRIEGTNKVTKITGEPVEYYVPPRRKVMFKTSSGLKEKLKD